MRRLVLIATSVLLTACSREPEQPQADVVALGGPITETHWSSWNDRFVVLVENVPVEDDRGNVQIEQRETGYSALLVPYRPPDPDGRYFKSEGRNQGNGCAENVRGLVRLYSDNDDMLDVVEWTAMDGPYELILRPGESFVYRSRPVPGTVVRAAVRYEVEVSWTTTRFTWRC